MLRCKLQLVTHTHALGTRIHLAIGHIGIDRPKCVVFAMQKHTHTHRIDERRQSPRRVTRDNIFRK